MLRLLCLELVFSKNYFDLTERFVVKFLEAEICIFFEEFVMCMEKHILVKKYSQIG